MECPICRETMVSQQQLGQHIDDYHQPQETGLLFREKTAYFRQIRQTHILSKSLEIHRLETRLGNLLVKLNAVEREYQGIRRLAAEPARKQVEQELAPWEPEQTIDRCRICRLKFSYFSRKHHCRVCGRVVCGDVERECSMEVEAKLLASKLEKNVTQVFAVRICCDCRDTVFGHQNFVQECTASPPHSVKQWAALKRRKAQIDALLPRFQGLVEDLSRGKKDPATLEAMKKVRTQLYGCLGQFDQLAKKLLEQNQTQTEERLSKMMLVWATDYMQLAMAPLQAIPQVMQSTEEPRIRKDEALKAQNTMVVLQEQLFMVEQMVAKAKKARKFDELPPLEASVKDLQAEISSLSMTLGSLAPR